jgi:hypothetical protein
MRGREKNLSDAKKIIIIVATDATPRIIELSSPNIANRYR